MKSLAYSAHPITRRIATIEERCRRELISVEERPELSERILWLKAKAHNRRRTLRPGPIAPATGSESSIPATLSRLTTSGVDFYAPQPARDVVMRA